MSKLRAIEVGLSLCIAALAACGDDSSEPADSGAGPERDSGDPGMCEAKPLDDFCTTAEPCPTSYDQAIELWCSQAPSSTTVRESSCGGRALRIGAGVGATIYHFDGDGELAGVHTESDLVRACSEARDAPTSSEQTYGRECTEQGLEAEACEIGGCPDIACISGAAFKVDWPFTFEQAKEIPLTACRNDQCFTGMLAADAQKPGGTSGVGFSVPEPEVIDRDHTGHAELRFWGSAGGGVYLEMQWWAWSDAELQDGDRYRVTADAPGGERVLLDREIDYGLTELGTGQCRQTCKYLEVDERGNSIESDGGLDDDAGF